MGRYTGPKEKLSRREGVDLGLKGERALQGKSAMERRPYPPGQHGRGRRRASEYSLERRLDNVVFRLGLASTRAQARQFVVHRHVTVNGKRVDRPSFEVSPEDQVAIK